MPHLLVIAEVMSCASTNVKLLSPYCCRSPGRYSGQHLLWPWTWVSEGIPNTEHSMFHCHGKGLVTADGSLLLDLELPEYLLR